MSFQAMAWAVEQKTGSTIGKAILLMLANYADSDGRCFPSYERIANDCECSRRSVISWVDRLEQLGLLKKEVRRRKDGTQTSNFITLQTECSTFTRSGHQGATGAVQGATGSKQGAARSPEPITYPITKPITERDVLNGKVKVHNSEDLFSAIVRVTGKSPFTNRDGFAFIDIKTLQKLEN